MNRHPLSIAQLISFSLVTIISVAFLAYVVYQARFLIIGPVLTFANEEMLVQNNRTVTVSGSAFNITEITLNDRPILTDERGNFAESIVLENGYTIIRIAARDRYGRETSIERTHVYVPQSTLSL